jgi:hypothetical protein
MKCDEDRWQAKKEWMRTLKVGVVEYEVFQFLSKISNFDFFYALLKQSNFCSIDYF